ncbi:F0F1 ATP synthase subunit epsilon [Wolbachia endosymbiont of Litomosoides brasiliensis]|uniref:F0F1 ATP synthase subunit epsilon n=1 Tax=Wolbachia endosymbiont of Litomosoides brasiliensis TaxID=1812117 RepID=UPI00158DCC9F|nr:F0F1 ATP synthase subunit epsilon [Wolbachia endosymbiont of Litomosoides brasiliensis]NUY39540.1 F0F1 ATP synthase subunit epsilon [Wolbachia endosymbiont of Litomosoides brasiliensis]
MKVQFFSPDDQISFKGVISLSVNGFEGELVILAHHSPYLIYLLPGIITIKTCSQMEKKIVIDNGILEVASNSCNIMTNQAQIFDHVIHDEELLKNKRISIYVSYLNGKFLS